jgi:RHS repeat-associated protein
MNYHENKKDGNIDSGNRGDFKERYNGKELDSSNGLDTYDYLARMYDPSLGRFMSVDPLSEKYYSISPYVYCMNNPVILTD